MAYVAAREEMRGHHEAVGGKGKALARGKLRQHRGVIASQQVFAPIGLEEHFLDDALHHLATATVAQHNGTVHESASLLWSEKCRCRRRRSG